MKNKDTEPLRLRWLDPAQPDEAFPPINQALKEPNGLLALGGDLSSTRLLNAYRQGIFPWYGHGEPILWWSPDPRCVFDPASVHVSRSLRRILNKKDHRVTFDRAFETVIRACAELRPGQDGTWLTPAMQTAYTLLHHQGWAHSVEVWRNDVLIGGIYGVAIGGAFFGESMFSRAPNASKIALVSLARQLAGWNFTLLDAQVGSAHLYTLGAVDLPRREFLQRLSGALALPGRSQAWGSRMNPAD